jgi:hypothetical protein
LDNLNIISFDIPYPANYGGVIDVFYKIKALAALGTKVHLHCFEYGRKHAIELETITESVHYYKRNLSRKLLLYRQPFIVLSRRDNNLIQRVLEEEYPVFMEGLHNTFLLSDERFSGRTKLVRTHNIEHEYYRNLAKIEDKRYRKLFYNSEASKLAKYEPILDRADEILTISERDHTYFQRNYSNVSLVPAFHPFENVDIQKGTGKYALYHGNLSVSENENVASYLVQEVFAVLKLPLVIAGLNPSNQLKRLVAEYKNVTLIRNPSEQEMLQLIQEAQILLNIASQTAGVKIKLLHSLFNGRHVIANRKMVQGSGLDELCRLANTTEQIIQAIHDLEDKPISNDIRDRRQKVLDEKYNNRNNARKIQILAFQ